MNMSERIALAKAQSKAKSIKVELKADYTFKALEEPKVDVEVSDELKEEDEEE